MPVDTVSSGQMARQVPRIVQDSCDLQHAILSAAIEKEVPGCSDFLTGNTIAAERQMTDPGVGHHALRPLLGAVALGIGGYVAQRLV